VSNARVQDASLLVVLASSGLQVHGIIEKGYGPHDNTAVL
jgi:hypothetical protein